MIGPEALPSSVAITNTLEIRLRRLLGIFSSFSKAASRMSGKTGIETMGAATPITMRPANTIFALFSTPKNGDVPTKAIAPDKRKSPVKMTIGLPNF